MQQNLIDLQPLLVDTSDKTEKLMIKIEQDTVVVEKQKEVNWDNIHPKLIIAMRNYYLFWFIDRRSRRGSC